MPSISTEIRDRQLTAKADWISRALHGVEIQVETGATSGLTQPERIDVIGPLLEGLNRQTASPELAAEPDRQGGLTG